MPRMAVFLLGQWMISFALAGVGYGTYSLRSIDPQFGGVEGKFVLRPLDSQNDLFERTVNLLDQQYQGYSLVQVWQGLCDKSGNCSAEIRQVHFIKSIHIDGKTYQRSKDAPKVHVEKFVLKPVGVNAELQRKFSTEDLRWISQDQSFTVDDEYVERASHHKIPKLMRKMMDYFLKKYHQDDFVKSYADQDRYKDGVHFFVRDRRGYTFYQTHSKSLLLWNKSMDPISMEEEKVRRNAFAFSLNTKAKAWDEKVASKHLAPGGVILPYRSDGQFEEDNDTALWTGSYVATQGYRWLATSDQEALTLMKKSLAALITMIEIADGTDDFARSLKKIDGTEVLPQDWKAGQGNYQGLAWKMGGNNDMFKGFAYGFTVALMALPKEETFLRNKILIATKKLLGKTIIRNDYTNSSKLIGLIAVMEPTEGHLETYHWKYQNAAHTILGPKYTAGISDWSGNHLGTVGLVTDILIAKLNHDSQIEDQQKRVLADYWEKLRSTDQHLMTMATWGVARSVWSSEEFSERIGDLQNGIWGLREFPIEKPGFDGEVDHSLNPNWVISPFPRLFWKYFVKKDLPASFGYQGIQSMPLFQMAVFDDNYIWKSASFRFRTKVNKNVTYAGVDYLHAYWLARWSGIVSDKM